jgi:uncharacterized membrane protein YkoI
MPTVTSTKETAKAMIARLLLLFAALGLTAVAPADARPRDREQDDVFRGTQEGRILPLRLIESRILPRMRGFDYIGQELIRGEIYRLKFMRGPQVVWIDVDARTGQVVGKSGF